MAAQDLYLLNMSLAFIDLWLNYGWVWLSMAKYGPKARDLARDLARDVSEGI